MPNPQPARRTPLTIRTTPAPRQSFPLPSTHFFTGNLFDTLVIFLQKHSIEWHSIQCVLRGDHPSTAVPTICISITSPEDMSTVAKLWEEERGLGFGDPNGDDGKLDELIPEEVVEVEFARVFADLITCGEGVQGSSFGRGVSGNVSSNSSSGGGGSGGAGGGNRTASTSGVLGGLLGTGTVGASIASLVAASMKTAPNRSDLSLVACTCPPLKLAEAAADRVPVSRRGEGMLGVRGGGEGPMDDDDEDVFSDDDYGCEIMEHQAACPTHGGD